VLELDMAFGVGEVIRGLERLLGAEQRTSPAGEPSASFAAPGGVTIEVRRMPPERMQYPTIFADRTLVVLRGDHAAVAAMNEKIALAFLRVGG
jgi:hypothetical protein